jgi:nucleoside-diphosphate-sugar epimerase
MKILATGADGLVGSAVVAHLLAHGHEVTTLTRPPDEPRPGVRVVYGDARDHRTVLEAVRGIDAVVHLAAIPGPSMASPYEVFANNTQASFTVLWTAAEAGVPRLVAAGSVNAIGLHFNPHKPRPARYPLDEDTPTDIADPYSLSKQIDEQIMRTVCRRFGASGMVLRLPMMVGPDNAAARFAWTKAHLEEGAGDAWAWLDVRDSAEAFRLALTLPYSGAHVAQLAAPQSAVEMPTAELLRRYAPGVPSPDYAGHEVPIDTSRAQRLLGFTPRLPPPSSIKD